MAKLVTVSFDPVERGRNGGRKRAKNLSAEEASAIGKKAAGVRWAGKNKKKKKAK